VKKVEKLKGKSCCYPNSGCECADNQIECYSESCTCLSNQRFFFFHRPRPPLHTTQECFFGAENPEFDVSETGNKCKVFSFTFKRWTSNSRLKWAKTQARFRIFICGFPLILTPRDFNVFPKAEEILLILAWKDKQTCLHSEELSVCWFIPSLSYQHHVFFKARVLYTNR